MKFKIGEPRQIERGKKEINNNECNFLISETKSLLGDKEKAIEIKLFDTEKFVGSALVEELNNKELGEKYIQLRLINIEPEYQGGNAIILLYEKTIEYAESLSKKLLFDSQLTIGAYKSFKRLEDYGYKIIENPDMKFNGTYYSNPKSWTMRVERENKNDKNYDKE